ncbi:MAG: hypothetical protein ABGZ17_07435 [Planctomycetaceae bacterium]
MSEKATLVFDVDETRDIFDVEIEIINTDSMNRDATFVLSQRVRVKDSDPVHDSKVVYEHRFRTDQRVIRFTIPATKLTDFCYSGTLIEIEYHGELRIDDAVFFDTKVSEEVLYKLLKKPKIRKSAKHLIDPKDRYNFFTNLRAVPFHNFVVIMTLMCCGLGVVAVNTLIGVHDQMSPESQTYFYRHKDGGGDSQSPFWNSLFGSGAVGSAIWYAMRRQLRNYMKFRLHRLPTRIDRSTSLPIEQLVHGRARVDLDNAVLRVVACNLEKGEYMRGSGSDRRTVSFREPVQGVLLYSQEIERIPANKPLETCFSGAVEFWPMFDGLYPPLPVTETHGLFVYWEVQLLLHKLVDQELVGSTTELHKSDFFDDES